MKKKFLAMMALASSLCASAQVVVDDTDDAGAYVPPVVLKNYVLSIGPKVGGNYSIAGDPDGYDIGMAGNIGYSAGLGFNIRFARPSGKPFGTERFGVHLEALYSMHSMKTDADNLNLSCYEVPLLFQWYFMPTFYVEVGPTFKGVISSSPKNLMADNTNFVTDGLKGNDVMLSLGVGYKHKNGFMAGLRYNMGNSDLAGNFNSKVSTISLSIGWLFNVVK